MAVEAYNPVATTLGALGGCFTTMGVGVGGAGWTQPVSPAITVSNAREAPVRPRKAMSR